MSARPRPLQASDARSRSPNRLAISAATFLRAQVDAGPSVVQLFDSLAGVLSAADYAERVLPHAVHGHAHRCRQRPERLGPEQCTGDRPIARAAVRALRVALWSPAQLMITVGAPSTITPPCAV